MKKNFFSTLLCLLTVGILVGFSSCSQEGYNRSEELGAANNISLKYVAPSGDTLFVNKDAFEASTMKVLSDIYGSNASKCIITDINHTPTPVGYVASIEYITPNGEEANYIMTNLAFKFEGGKLELAESPLKSRNRLKSTNGPVKIKSLAIIPANAKKVSVNSNEGTFTYSCQGDAIMKYDIK
ncbi:hypothetical protein JGH11_17935 [Dysgonomonas sp. Marseille-P4677]|uniref:hypothetical protein n=1 Tax=Dysgonomonas sp. Marseille-P4677 TaxID=2364790 RepID=UPI0019127850|nr:hypothetical protein [Dysgonomonas sp. Marseille-P4677]MBK5722754.1 hypothetical protein [Dysgonomonas sp. Marseille-P4677]